MEHKEQTVIKQALIKNSCWEKRVLPGVDRVVYKGSEPIPGMVEFSNSLPGNGFPFLSSNSQQTGRDVCYKLRRPGFDVDEEHGFTCDLATGRNLISKKPHGTAYFIGDDVLLGELHKVGYSIVNVPPDYVIIGSPDYHIGISS